MIVICVMDDHGGMLFNHRRQSQDRILRAWILQRTKGKKLWMNAYSYEQFAAGDYCFVETCRLKAVESRIEAVIVYRWNRSYPTDFWLDLALTPPHWVQTHTAEFAGNSHPCITEEIYLPAVHGEET